MDHLRLELGSDVVNIIKGYIECSFDDCIDEINALAPNRQIKLYIYKKSDFGSSLLSLIPLNYEDYVPNGIYITGYKYEDEWYNRAWRAVNRIFEHRNEASYENGIGDVVDMEFFVIKNNRVQLR